MAYDYVRYQTLYTHASIYSNYDIIKRFPNTHITFEYLFEQLTNS